VYDTIRKQSLTWTQKLSDQLNLAHAARKKREKEETKTNQTPVIREGSLEGLRKTMEERICERGEF